MRYRVPQEAYADRRLQGNDLRVLLAIASHAKPDGSCWPAQGTIAERLGMQRQHVNRAVGRLEDFGYLLRVGRSGYRSCLYYLTVPTVADDGSRSCTTGGSQTPSENYSPPYSPPPPSARGDVAASPDGDTSPVRRPRAARGRRGGQEAATPPPDPRPSDRGGGAMVPVDIAGAAKALARQVGRGAKSATAPPRGPPDTAIVRAINSGVLTEKMVMQLIRREMEIGEEAALEEFGFTRRGSPKTGGKP